MNKQTQKNMTRYILFIIFLAVSIMFITPVSQKAKSIYRSSELTKVVLKDGNSERTEYRDSSGRLTIAADKGYAVMVVTSYEYGILEKYYDDQYEPTRRYDGYFAVLREYNEKGNIIRNTYLDENDNPMMTWSGYAVQERSYNDKGQITAIIYKDTEGNPVCTSTNGYGGIYEYNEEGKSRKTTFIDDSGKPMMTAQGFASVVEYYYTEEGPQKGRIEKEFYYNEKDEPVSLSLGQYGIHKEYNELGQNTVLTYLDATGAPMITNKGYTTVVRTFHPNGYVASELYYDLEGKPFSLTEGQYGVKQENGQTVYLNENGKETFNLKNLLYNHSWIVIPAAIMIIIVSALLDKKWNTILLLVYLIVIAYLTLMFRESEETNRVMLLWYYRRIFVNSTARADILKNIWLFIPLGGILYQLYPKKTILLIPVMLSVLVEGIQFITGLGICELDDVISNGIGGWIGFMAGKLAIDIKLRIIPQERIHLS